MKKIICIVATVVAISGCTAHDGGLSNKTKGAMLGGVAGGILGNQNSTASGGSKTVCQTETRYTEESKTVYSHSTITFVYEGKRYSVNFKK